MGPGSWTGREIPRSCCFRPASGSRIDAASSSAPRNPCSAWTNTCSSRSPEPPCGHDRNPGSTILLRVGQPADGALPALGIVLVDVALPPGIFGQETPVLNAPILHEEHRSAEIDPVP